MPGMKEGTSGPFPEDEDEDEGAEVNNPFDVDDSTAAKDSSDGASAEASEESDSHATMNGTEDSAPPEAPESTGSTTTGRTLRSTPEELAERYTPKDYDLSHAWALGRSTVKDGRPVEKTFFLQEQIVEDSGCLEAQASDEVEEILGDSVSTTDLREAALIIGYSNPQLIAELLSAWGAEVA